MVPHQGRASISVGGTAALGSTVLEDATIKCSDDGSSATGADSSDTIFTSAVGSVNAAIKLFVTYREAA